MPLMAVVKVPGIASIDLLLAQFLLLLLINRITLALAQCVQPVVGLPLFFCKARPFGAVAQ